MKILFAVSSLSSGGAERVASTLCNAWVNQGKDVLLVPTFSGQSTCFYKLDQRVKVTYLSDIIKIKNNTPIAQLKRLLALRKLIKKSEPDVIVSFLTNVNVAILVASLNLEIPTIICERSNFQKIKMSKLLILQSYITYKWATILTVQTKAAALFFRRKMKIKNIEIIPNPIPQEIENISVKRCPKNKHSDGKKLVAIGRLCSGKKFDLLVKAFSKLPDSLNEWKLFIYGEGPERKYLEELIDSLNLNDRIQIPGRIENIWEEIIIADAFVMSSSFEGFPNVLLEAMALGLPCISTDCPDGPNEITEQGKYALLVPVNDIDSLSQALYSLMVNENLRNKLGRIGSQAVIEKYSLIQVLSMWELIFQKALTIRRKHS